jgi:hypothetical protein
MTRKLLSLAIGATMLLAVGTVADAQDAGWIHVRVNEGEGTNVNVNLPMSLLTVAMEIAQKHAFDGDDMDMDFGDEFDGHIRFGRHNDIEIDDLRAMWTELREAGDADYVQVQDDDETVNIYRRGDTVYIEVDEDGDDKVRMQVPFSVVDVLLEGEGNELNLVGALNEMALANDGEVLQVNDGDTTVRIWIDNNPQG